MTSQTLLTPPAGSGDPNDGHILVQAFDRDALPLAGQTVSLTGPESASQTTTSDGCAFFAYLDPGTYTASLSTTGYVDRQGGQPASQSVGGDGQPDHPASSSTTTGRPPWAVGLVAPSGGGDPDRDLRDRHDRRPTAT